ncbi:hypothetical protein Bbelb_106380, partial [Branchiostoma belcheri]
ESSEEEDNPETKDKDGSDDKEPLQFKTDQTEGAVGDEVCVGSRCEDGKVANEHRSEMTGQHLTIFLVLLPVAASIRPSVHHDHSHECPDDDPTLTPWNPGHDVTAQVVVGRGQSYLLQSSATFLSLEIKDGGKLVFADLDREIVLKSREITVGVDGEFHIGSEACRYQGRATVSLYGRSDEQRNGKQFLVTTGGTMEVHGRQKLSWTQLAQTVPAGGLPRGTYYYDSYNRWTRGVNIRAIDETSGSVVDLADFDTYDSDEESRRLADFIERIPSGRIVALAANDEASRWLEDSAKSKIRELGSVEVDSLGHRDPWAFVGVKGDPSAAVEQRITYIDTNVTGTAAVSARFHSVFGAFEVGVTSEWVGGQARCTFSVNGSAGAYVINLKHDVTSWQPGDHIVLASTDYDMEQAEEFQLLPCPECSAHQVKINGKARYTHFGEVSDEVDMRGEVGLLTRNVRFQGEVEDSCYGDNFCQFFHYDTYGGHLKILRGFKNVHLSGVEFTRMGQQVVGSYPVHFHMAGELILRGFKNVHLSGAEFTRMGQQVVGSYPVHFHMAGDVDELGGYTNPTYVRELSIHHCFSRCVTIHGTNGLLVQDTVGYDTLGHCFFLEDGVEQRNVLNLGLVAQRFNQRLPPRLCRFKTRSASATVRAFKKRLTKDCLLISVQNTVGYDTLGHCFFLEDGVEQWNVLDRNLGLVQDTVGVGGATVRAFKKRLTKDCLLVSVQDTVGYDTLGHCFFLEDGVEQRNVLDRNLGLVTRAGTLLPTDRDDSMCRDMRGAVYGDYVPQPYRDCQLVSDASSLSKIYASSAAKRVSDTLKKVRHPGSEIQKEIVLDRNLGLVTRAGTLLPTDRDDSMCRGMRDAVYGDYVPMPYRDCQAVSTFWIAHPNNVLTNNAAAGSLHGGIWYIFHRKPTGLSDGSAPMYESERTPLGRFFNNRVHSNGMHGLMIDDGVKYSLPTASNPQEYLARSYGRYKPHRNASNRFRLDSLVSFRKTDPFARYKPHQNADLRQPRVPAMIEGLIAFKNWLEGAWVREGTSGSTDARTFPNDEGSSQQVWNSIFIGESENAGSAAGARVWGMGGVKHAERSLPQFAENVGSAAGARVWGMGGVRHAERSLPQFAAFPLRGLDVYDGPILAESCTFKKYAQAPQYDRWSSAIGFHRNNTWQNTPRNNVTKAKFEDVQSRVFVGERGLPGFATDDRDGDKTNIVHDWDGSITGYPDTYVVGRENHLTRNPGCVEKPDWRAYVCSGKYAQDYRRVELAVTKYRFGVTSLADWRAYVCSGKYAQLFILAQWPNTLVMSMVRDEYPDRPMTFTGPLKYDAASHQQYQPVVMLEKSYTVHWDGRAPESLRIYPINFDSGDWLRLGICYPPGTMFRLMYQLERRFPYAVTHDEEIHPVSSLHAVEHGDGHVFYFEESTGLLFVKIRSHFNRDGHSYCSHMGCERVVISATMTSDEVSNCTAATYPKYSLTPTETVPMPSYQSIANNCTGCGAPGPIVSDDSLRFLEVTILSAGWSEMQSGHIPFIEIDGDRYDRYFRGFMVISVDARSGDVTRKMTFDTYGNEQADLDMANFIRNDIPVNSIVLVAVRDESSSKADECLKALKEIGAQEPVKTDYRGNFAMIGYKGNVWPTWIQQVNLPSNQGPAYIYAKIPLMG